jgi:hypothetical protein
MSGLDAADVEAQARAEGAAGFVVKGGDLTGLLAVARELVAEQRASSPP